MPYTRKKQKLILLSFLLLLLFSYPLISVANKPVRVAGIPFIVVYIFCGWLLVIGLARGIIVSKRRQHHE